MCHKPRQLKVNFYCKTEDMSVFTKLKVMAFDSMRLCKDGGCGKYMLNHSHYWYHGSGCVQAITALRNDAQKLNQKLAEEI
jgi:hypothetical protein